jgi:transcriptional regulator
MQPDSVFRLDEAARRHAARAVAVAHVFVAGRGGVAVIDAPPVMDAAGDLSFHVSRRNRALPPLDGARAIAPVAGPHACVSPDRYAADGQVPTWDHWSLEAAGSVAPLTAARTIAQRDAAGDTHGALLAPKPAWHRDKLPPRRFEAMLGGIAGFVIRARARRGTAKWSQNTPAADVAGMVLGLRAAVHAANAARA